MGAAQITLQATDVAGLHRALTGRGVAAEWGPEVYSYGCREFAIRDPNGYLLIFSEETDDPATCDVDD